jgi:16S rRNA (guanine966-N2)-methyltransferase
MRIIAGIHRGRKLLAPEGLITRPMTDRVRENLFNILAPRLEGAVVLDLFCGSGALGLEALSRGALLCLFVDADPAAVKATETNAATLLLSGEVRIVRRDALRPGTWIKAPGGAGYTLVFADPPYRLTADEAGRQRLAEMARSLADLGYLAPGAVAMLRTKRGVPMDRPWPGFNLFDERTYGTTTLHLMEYAGTNI